MSAPLHVLLADELEISEDRAQKLLHAMLREVRKRASRGDGVRIPDLGSFSVEDGDVVFRPSPSLARSVNRRFAGLGSENLTLPEANDDGGGPATITPGFDSEGWKQATGESDASSADTDEFEAPGDTDEFEAPADTDEFDAPPDTDEVDTPASTDESSDAADTDAFEPPASASESSAEDPASAPDEAASEPEDDETPHRLYPEPDPEPSSPAASMTEEDTVPPETPASASLGEEDDEDDASGSVWDENSAWDLSSVSLEDDEEEDAEAPAAQRTKSDPAASEPEPELETETTPSSSDPTPETNEPQPADRSPRQPSPPADASSSSNTGLKVATGLVAVLLLAFGAWFVLGQQGVVPKPGTLLAQRGAPPATQGATSQDASEQDQSSASDSESSTRDASDRTPATSSTGNGDASGNDTSPTETSSQQGARNDASRNETQTPAATPSTNPPSTNPPSTNQSATDRTQIQSGWTIIVASRESSGPAQELASTYRARFQPEGYPVAVIRGESGGNVRYRVGVGEFSSGEDARGAIDRFNDRLPPGAWPLEVQ